MNFTRVIFGLLFAAAGVALAPGAPSEDIKITAPPRKSSPSLSDTDRGSSPGGPQTDSGRRGGLEDTVEIVGVKEGTPEPDGKRVVTVRVSYALVHYPKGVLGLGFNLKSATKFVQVATNPIMAGSEEIELSATIVPVTWPKRQPFKVYVSLSAEPHPGEWSLLAASAQAMKPAPAPEAKEGKQ